MGESNSNMNLQQTETLCSNEHFTEHNEKLQVFFEDQQYCDVKLISADDEYKVMAHKFFLASISKYFHALFDESLQESNTNEVKISQIDGRSLKLILNFIYKGIIELSDDTVESVLMGSHVLEINALEKLSCSYIQKSIFVSNCLGISILAKRHNNKELYEAAMLCACENFVALRDEDEFKSQSFDQLCELISRNDLRIPSECDVFHGILNWINFVKDIRKEFLEKLFTYVRFPLLPPKFIGEVIGKVAESYKTLRIVFNALTWHAAPNYRSTIFTREQCRIRNLKDVIVSISGNANSVTGLSVGLYYFGLNEWIYTKWPAIPAMPRDDMKYSLLNNKLLIAFDVSCNNIQCLNLESLEWTKFPNYTNIDNTRGIPLFVITLNGAVYIISGNYISKLTNPFEEWISFPVSPRLHGQNHLSINGPYATYNNLMYFPENNREFYSTYDFVTNYYERLIRRININSEIVGVQIIQNLDVDYLIEISRNAAVVYNLKNTTNSEFQHQISFDLSCTKTAVHGKNIIIYGPNKFYEYNVFKNTMRALPHLINITEEVTLLTNGNGGS